jgi:hypothetical protein
VLKSNETLQLLYSAGDNNGLTSDMIYMLEALFDMYNWTVETNFLDLTNGGRIQLVEFEEAAKSFSSCRLHRIRD